MRESRRTHLLMALAALLIAGTLAVYAAILRSWLWGKPSPPPGKNGAAPEAADEPAAERALFRNNFLDPRAHFRLSEALYRSGRPVDAFYVMFAARGLFGEAVFRRAHAFVVLHRESHFLGTDDFDPSPENEQRLKARLQDDPENPDLLNYLAHIAAERGNFPEAQRLLDLGLTAHAEDRGLLAYKAELTAASDLLGAIPISARLVNSSPDSYEARLALEELGRLARRQDSGPQGEAVRLAREALDELRRAHPEHPLIFSTIVLSAWERGERDSARALVAEILARSPGHPGALMMDGFLALSDHDADRAMRRFTEAWERNPEGLISASRLAQLYLRQRSDREAALPYYLALYRENPDYNDGRPAEEIIRGTLDARREQLLENVGAEALGRYLSSDDASLRAEACIRTAKLEDPRWIERLGELLDDDAEIVRHNADYALYHIGRRYPDAVRARREEWLSSPDRPLLRARALNLFADLYPQETFPLALRSLYDPQPVVRYLSKTMVLDRYYQEIPAARKAVAEHLAAEKNPAVLALYGLAGRRKK